MAKKKVRPSGGKANSGFLGGSSKFGGGFIKGIMKASAAAAAVALVASVGLEGAARITGDEDLSIMANIVERLNDVKNEEEGCCLPACGKEGETMCTQLGGESWVAKKCKKIPECEEVCCYPLGMMSRMMCEKEPDGQVAGKDKCEKGYTVILKTSGSEAQKNFGEGLDGKWVMEMGAYTCGEDPENAKWSGDWEWQWSVKFPGNTDYHDTDKVTDVASFITSGGSSQFNVGASQAVFHIDSDDVTVNFFMPRLGEVEMTGNLSKGYGGCNDDDKGSKN